jgi:hypothetical protein
MLPSLFRMENRIASEIYRGGPMRMTRMPAAGPTLRRELRQRGRRQLRRLPLQHLFMSSEQARA